MASKSGKATALWKALREFSGKLPGRVKGLPRWTHVLGIVVIVGIVAALVAPYFLDVDRYRTAVATTIEQQTGRPVSIGKIRARLLPSVGFVIEDFRLGNPSGFGAGDVLTADAVKGNLAFWPLLRKEFQLRSLEIVRPRLLLLENDSGQTNYGDFPARHSSGVPPRGGSAAPAGMQLAEIDTVELKDAEVTLGRITGRSGDVLPSLRARKLSAELRHVALAPLEVKRWEVEAPLSGALLELPGWKDAVKFQSGRVHLRGGAVESEFRAALGKSSEAKGSLHVADVEHGVVAFALEASQLDVGELLPSRGTGPRPAHATHPARSELMAQGHLSVERLRWSPYTANNVRADLRVFNDRVELWPLQMETYGGVLQISARADRTQMPERFSANVQVHNLDVGRMLSASSALKGKLSGAGELNLQLFGALSEQWQRSLSGSGRFAVRDGRLPRLDLSGALQTLANLAGAGGETAFRVIEGDVSLAGGRVASRTIHLDSPHGTIDLHGSCTLDGTLDYEGQAVLAPGAGGGAQNSTEAIGAILGSVLRRDVGRVSVPFSLRGTFANPKIFPGRGLPAIGSPQSASPLQEQKKSILDIFRKP